MTKNGRKTACVVTLIFIAGVTIASTVRFTSMAGATDGPQHDASPALVTNVLGRTEFPTAGQDAPAPAAVVDSKRTIVLRGKVFGPGDHPIAGARLYLSVDEWTDSSELGTSDANGAYRFVVPEQTLRRTVSPNFVHAQCNAALIVTAPGFGPGWEELLAVQGGRMGDVKPEYSQDFHLGADFPIAGRIVDAVGNPIAGAAVAAQSIYDLADRRWYKMPAAIKAGNPNLMSREESDPNNWFTPLYPTAWSMIPPATTDLEGRFQLVGVGRDRAIRLAVSGPGIRSASASVLTRDDVAEFTEAIRKKYPRMRRPLGYFYPPRKDDPEGDQGVQLFGPSPTIEVDPARTVTGVVRDASTGEPIVNHLMGIASGSGYASAHTDIDGRYHILRDEDDPSIVMFTDQYHTDRYLITVRRLTDAKGFGDIVASPGLPMFAGMQVWKESDGFHRLFPYVKLKTRTRNDGAPEGDAENLPGFTGPIPLSAYDAYQVINPSATTMALDLTMFVPRAPSRTLQFVDPDGRAIRGVTVEGLLAPSNAMTFALDGSEAEVLALEPGTPRQVTVNSNDGKYSASVSVSTDDPQPRLIHLERARSESGRLLDAPMPP
jgi:hypothetical protein